MLRIAGGMDMFINQAAQQFVLFTGEKINTETLRNILKKS
ncbi:MAG: hypothetical protein ISS77_00435 [Phycisphaerae bacterium]|nr:hypothetical protein [Phycisphaerae bacterium]